jgi:cobyrinic acid a,c-diamide synthase
VSLSLLAACRQKALSVSVFKKGPDYIDAAWLGRVAGRDCHNLDTYLSAPDVVQRSFAQAAAGSELALLESNRGLFDGLDLQGTHSSAALAQLLKMPVILVVDCTKATRTVAALVRGCLDFDPELQIAGVVLNRIAGPRHEKIVRETIEKYNGVPVLGAIPKFDREQRLIPGRHLGLVPPTEFAADDELLSELSRIGAEYLDLERILQVARDVEPLTPLTAPVAEAAPARVRIGYFCDPVFTFYYPENLTALRAAGAELVPINSLDDRDLPAIDGLYIGGGFPETFAAKLAENESLRTAVRSAGESGLPIYAECGGLIYLSRSLKWKDNTYQLAGLLPLDLELQQRPAGHGYAEVVVDQPNPFFKQGEIIRGHEFHYSRPLAISGLESCLAVQRGVGVGEKRDGLVYKATMASYLHIHADGVPNWAPALVAQAEKYRRKSQSGGGSSKAFATATLVSQYR